MEKYWKFILAALVSALLILLAPSGEVKGQVLPRGIKMREAKEVQRRIDRPIIIDLPARQRFVSLITPEDARSWGFGYYPLYITEPMTDSHLPRQLSIYGPGSSPGSLREMYLIQEHSR